MSGVYMTPVFTDVSTNESFVTIWETNGDKFYISREKITGEIDKKMKEEFVRLIKQKIKNNDYMTLTQLIKYFFESIK